LSTLDRACFGIDVLLRRRLRDGCRIIEAECGQDDTQMLQSLDGDLRITEPNLCAEGGVEHPRWYNLTRAVGHDADVDVLTTPSLAVLNLDIQAASWMPPIVEPRTKSDMGTMTLDLQSEERTITDRGHYAARASRRPSTA
jgi:hypothetical protein